MAFNYNQHITGRMEKANKATYTPRVAKVQPNRDLQLKIWPSERSE